MKSISSLQELLSKHQPSFDPIVPFQPGSDKIIALDFTTDNKELTKDIFTNTTIFIEYIDKKLKKANALYGIGGYGEHRTIYSMSQVFDAGQPDEEPRRLHLGLDIWGKSITCIMAPFDGTVHSFAFNNQLGDYGATIILSHVLEGETFYSLYGHLSLNSILNLQQGKKIAAGEVFASFGIPAENGQWPPHLHFQLIQDIGNWTGDYPGVCKFSEKDRWLANSPDPEIILQLRKFIPANNQF